MKKNFILAAALSSLMIAAILVAPSCKTIARAAAKYWTNRQIKEFVSKCEDKSSFIIGADNAKKYCDCAVDVVAEKYRNYDDVKKASLTDVLKIANDCK